MLSNLFKPKANKNKCYHFLIGYQNIIVLELKASIEEIMFDKTISKLLTLYDNIYWFSSYIEMEEELDILVNNTQENYIVIIN